MIWAKIVLSFTGFLDPVLGSMVSDNSKLRPKNKNFDQGFAPWMTDSAVTCRTS